MQLSNNIGLYLGLIMIIPSSCILLLLVENQFDGNPDMLIEGTVIYKQRHYLIIEDNNGIYYKIICQYSNEKDPISWYYEYDKGDYFCENVKGDRYRQIEDA